MARFTEDLTASCQAGWYSVISLHGGRSPEAMKRAIWRQYPVADQTALVERLLERGLLTAETSPKLRRQPGRCCAMRCQVPAAPPAVGSTLIPN